MACISLGPVTWRERTPCVQSRQSIGRPPQPKAGGETFLRNLTSIPPLCHYEIYHLKKSSDAFSFWGKKGAFHCIKQRLVYLDKPLFELQSSADEGCSWCVPERSLGSLSSRPRKKSEKPRCWVTWKAQHLRTSFCLGFPSALYWRQTFTKKGRKKKKRFWEKLIFFDESII